MITTIIFDLSEVLLTGLKGTEERINIIYGTQLKNPILASMPEAKKLFHGVIAEDDYWFAVIRKFKLKATVQELKQVLRNNIEEIEGTHGVVERLKKNGYMLGLLSVHAKEWIDYCEEMFDLHKLFHYRSYSFETAVSKPDKRAYTMLLEKMKVEPEECIFIDDYIVNLQSAEELGIATIQFENAKQLERDLKKLQIRL
jgi:putative hydrolase of the HAD superfamily